MTTINELIDSVTDEGTPGRLFLCAGYFEPVVSHPLSYQVFRPLTEERWIETLIYRTGWCGMKNDSEHFAVLKDGEITHTAVNLIGVWQTVRGWELYVGGNGQRPKWRLEKSYALAP